MKVFRIIAITFSMMMSGCAVTNVMYDYDAGYDFSQLSRYNWLEMPVDYPVDYLSLQRVKAAVDKQLKNKGYSTATASPDFIVSLQGYKTTIRREPESTKYSSLTGQRLANEQFQEGMFTLTMIDAKTDRLIWEGHVKGLAGPYRSTENKVSKLDQTVSKLLASFPPH